MRRLRDLNVDVGGLQAGAFALRLRLRGGGSVDRAVGHLLLENPERSGVSGDAVVEELLLDLQRTHQEVVAGEIAAHRQAHHFENGFACLRVVACVDHFSLKHCRCRFAR